MRGALPHRLILYARYIAILSCFVSAAHYRATLLYLQDTQFQNGAVVGLVELAKAMSSLLGTGLQVNSGGNKKKREVISFEMVSCHLFIFNLKLNYLMLEHPKSFLKLLQS